MKKHIDEVMKEASKPSAFAVFEDAANGVSVGWFHSEEYGYAPICHMRWVDGLNSTVVRTVKADAALIAHCLNTNQMLLAALKRSNAKLEMYYKTRTGFVGDADDIEENRKAIYEAEQVEVHE